MDKTRPKLEPHNTKTGLYFRRQTMPEVAKAAGVSVRHLDYVITGQRPGSQRVYEALRNALGPSGWRFACGDVAVLCADSPPPAEAQP